MKKKYLSILFIVLFVYSNVFSQNVGIGTSNPQAKLNIIGTGINSLSDNGYLMLGYNSLSNIALDYHQIQARNNGQSAPLYLNYFGGQTWIGNPNGSKNSALLTNPDGTVLIGPYNPAPGYKLTVEPAGAGNGIYINDPGNGYSLYSLKSGTTGGGIHVEVTDKNNDNVNTIEAVNKSAGSAIYANNDGSVGGNGVTAYSGAGGIGVFASSLYWGIFGSGSVYAGYFNGDVFSNGTYLGSDQKLKQNINDVSSAMEIINQLHPKYYEYRHDGNYKLMNLPNGEHYGLIAQDVEKVLPNLVKDTKFETRYAKPHTTAEDIKNSETIDFKALNYTELIPIIIKGMQEQQAVNDKQQQQIDELKKLVQTLSGNKSSLKSSLPDKSSAYLQQNSPNPFSQNTVISCYMPSSVKKAQLVVYSNDGKSLKPYPINNSGMNEVTMNADTLSSGEYVYALLIGGKKIDSKPMMLTK
ncbi:MAG TPA: tail fiber domain-containing protein [Chitinophagaceae bacterium]|nr:tail fiber domain-containing protein [Chitinophagaceae bacterium]